MRLWVKTSLSKLGGKSLKNDGSKKKKKKKIDDSKRYAWFLSLFFCTLKRMASFLYFFVLSEIPLMKETYYSKKRKLKTYYLENKSVSVAFKRPP